MRWLGGDFDACIEVNLLRGDARGDSALSRSWNDVAVFSHSAKMEFDRTGDAPQSGVDGLPRCDATRQVRVRTLPSRSPRPG
jgi:hypothetical protein